MITMFDFGRRKAKTDRRARRRPVTIGFEQLEVREVCSAGVALTIIPTEPRPLTAMPRPQVGSFDPQAERPVMVVMTPRREPVKRGEPGPSWPLGRRFRFW
jgi:hypothetical protein